MHYKPLGLSAQTMYAQALDASLATVGMRSCANLKGSFTSKIVKGHKYWYFQFTALDGKQKQAFLGSDTNERVHALMAKSDQQPTGDQISRISQAALSLGCTAVQSLHFKVIKRIEDYGFFQAGGLLVGTHAFLTYGNMLGVTWTANDRTQDIDFAHAGKNISFALMPDAQARTIDAIDSLEMGFLPVITRSGHPSASYVLPSSPDFRLDFLTPETRTHGEPYTFDALQINLQPLKFMDYLLEKVEQAVLLGKSGGALINLPDPARYALHKLIIAGERQASFRTKSRKDLEQAAALLTVLHEQSPELIQEAWIALSSRGKGWTSRVSRGLDQITHLFPNVPKIG